METERNGRLLLHNKYVVGWLGSSIHDFLEVLPRNSKATAFALITSLDSDPKPKSLLKRSRELKAVLNGVKALKNGLLVPSRVLQENRDKIFFGFDEIWFFPTSKIEPKPESPWIVGPGRIDRTKLEALGDWMASNECSLALGDGDGLNFIVKPPTLMRCLIAHSLAQPEPGLQTSGYLREDTGET
jgi:hypothetical protein